MQPKHESIKKKKKYEKPRLRIIRLETQQVLGIGCKLVDGGVAIGATPCPANFCAEPGS